MPKTSWAAYAERWSAQHGGYDVRRSSPVVRGWLLVAYWLSRVLARLPISPNAVTAVGLLLSVAVPLTAGRGSGWPLAAAALVVLSALADTVDGALALISERVSRLGQVYDSVADRVAEACWLVALALVGAPVWLAVTCGGFAWLHEYVRARAMVAGMTEIGAVTVAERPTRVLVVVFALTLAGLDGAIDNGFAVGTAAVATAIWTVLGAVALAQLFAAVRHSLR